MPLQRDPRAELLTLWHQMPAGDQTRLVGFAKALVEQRTGKRLQRSKRHQTRPP